MESLTKEEMQMLGRLADRTWQYVGGEFEEMCGGSCSLDERVEAVFDADRIDQQARTDKEKALLKKFDGLDVKERYRIARKVMR
jgi:hypothetical protein